MTTRSIDDDPYTLSALVVGRTIWPRGPLGHEPNDSAPWGSGVAIGFCPRCSANARRTTTVRGVFDCPVCVHVWYDDRVGEQTRKFSDFFNQT